MQHLRTPSHRNKPGRLATRARRVASAEIGQDDAEDVEAGHSPDQPPILHDGQPPEAVPEEQARREVDVGIGRDRGDVRLHETLDLAAWDIGAVAGGDQLETVLLGQHPDERPRLVQNRRPGHVVLESKVIDF